MPSFDGALCAEPGIDPELFFSSDVADVDAATELCWHCDARAECRAWALEHPFEAGSGVWGATTASERRLGYRPARGPVATSNTRDAIAKRERRALARQQRAAA